MNDTALARDPDLYANTTLFLGVPYRTVEPYLRDCETWTLGKGDLLISPQNGNETIFIVLSGALEVHLERDGADPLCTLRVGECVGEMSIIDRHSPSAYVLAAEPSTLLAIDRDTLWQLVHGSHGVAANLLVILSSRLRASNEVIADNLEIRRQIEQVAMVDALTGLHNRRWLDNALQRQLDRSVTRGDPLTVIMADVDSFKPYNDRHGHLAGDRVLVTVAQAMKERLRPNDMIARFGGEEFVVLLPDTRVATGRGIAKRLREAVEGAAVVTPDGKDLPGVTISLGLAELGPESSTAQSLLAAADAALYRAKRRGRNRISG